ncbi:hypothetical protein NUH88_15715 [Nisaea acidiphila]|uniref:Uncharacterized protein n=1 Tax=Nisaea acidiphila TaxID=1862145 RepID=A0A9J7AMH4_9PROT|nr:hypothetical protein [Nisaea acidiphila]UUX48843.1 hypothetical protein NUH88_15715 [Nisaea acidiphila]
MSDKADRLYMCMGLPDFSSQSPGPLRWWSATCKTVSDRYSVDNAKQITAMKRTIL